MTFAKFINILSVLFVREETGRYTLWLCLLFRYVGCEKRVWYDPFPLQTPDFNSGDSLSSCDITPYRGGTDERSDSPSPVVTHSSTDWACSYAASSMMKSSSSSLGKQIPRSARPSDVTHNVQYARETSH